MRRLNSDCWGARDCAPLTPKTVRFYEESGLVTPTARSGAGYRLFSTTDIRRLRLIRRAKLLGLPLADVKEFADLAFQETCGAFEERLQELVDQRLTDIERAISDLEHLRAELGNLRMGLVEGRTENATCAVEDCDDCRLIDD